MSERPEDVVGGEWFDDGAARDGGFDDGAARDDGFDDGATRDDGFDDGAARDDGFDSVAEMADGAEPAGVAEAAGGVELDGSAGEDAAVDGEGGLDRGVDGTATDAAVLVRTIEGLLFLSPDPIPVERLVEATGAPGDAMADAVAELDRQYEPGRRGLIIKRVAGGLTFGTDPICEPAARALLSTQRIPPLSAAQAETLAIVAYLQPVARPEISRIRGVAADSATATLLERGLIEEAGRSEFGAVLYRTTSLFLRLFGIDSLGALPDVSTWDPAPEEEDELRDRLLRAGGARSGGAGGGPAVELPEPRELGEDPGHVDMPGDRFVDGG